MRRHLFVSVFALMAMAATAFAQEELSLPDQPLVPDPAAAPLSDLPDWIEPETASLPPPEPEWLRKATPDTVVCPFRGRIRYKPGEIECGLIQVPENRDVPGSRTIELFFVRLIAKGNDADGKDVETRPDPVIYLTGGPGVSADYYVGRLKDHRILERRDLYILEQRGIGNSTKPCPFFDLRNRAEQIKDNFVDQQRVVFQQARACVDLAAAQGVDLRGYNTIENARDVRALRQALGFERWNVWGISYGSVLGQAVAKVDADGIQAMVIDAIVPLDIAELMRVPSWYQRDLDKLTAACDAQPACRDAYPDLQRRYLAAIQSVLDRPFALEVTPNEQFPDGKAYLFADIVAGLPFSLLYDEKTHAAIPAIIEGLTRAVERRDDTLFKAIVVAMGMGPVDDSFGAGMSMAIRCQDGYIDNLVRSAPGEQAAHPVLAAAFIGDPQVIAEMSGACAELGLSGRDPSLYAPLQSDLPIVVANGAWDPITPTPLAEYIMPGLGNAQLVEFPHAGHGPTRSLECGGEFLNAFFDDPSAPLDTACVEEGGEAATYIAPYFETDALARAAVRYDASRKAVAAHAAWGGVSIAIVGLGLLVFVFGGLVRRLNRAPHVPGGPARWFAGLAALSGVAYVAGLAAAGAVTHKAATPLLLFGLVGWAQWFAWLGPVTGALGLVALVLAALSGRLGLGSRIGCVLVAAAAISLSVFGLVWGFWPI